MLISLIGDDETAQTREDQANGNGMVALESVTTDFDIERDWRQIIRKNISFDSRA